MTRTVENDDLKPCPYCGGEAEITDFFDPQRNDMPVFYIWCKTSGCLGRHGSNVIFDTKEECKETWNTRADLVPSTELKHSEAIKQPVTDAERQQALELFDGLMACINDIAKINGKEPLGEESQKETDIIRRALTAPAPQPVDVETFANEIVDVMRPYKLCDRHVNHTAATLIAKHIAQTYDLVKKVK